MSSPLMRSITKMRHQLSEIQESLGVSKLKSLLDYTTHKPTKLRRPKNNSENVAEYFSALCQIDR